MPKQVVIKISEPQTKMNPEGLVALERMPKVFGEFQAAFNVMGTVVFEKTGATTGRFTKRVEDYCTLYVTDLKLGSIAVSATPYHSQQTLEGDCPGDMVTREIEKVFDIIDADGDEDELMEIIPGDGDRQRFLKHLEDFWPDMPVEDEEVASIEIGFGKSRPKPLNPIKREVISHWARSPPQDVDVELTGAISELRVMDGHRFRLKTPHKEILCHYQRELEGQLRDYLGKAINIHGKGRLVNGVVAELNDIHDIEPFDHLELYEVGFEGRLYVLSRPLEINIDLSNDYWILTNDEFDISVGHERFLDAEEGVRAYFAFLYQSFVMEPHHKMTDGARRLQRALRELVKKVEDV